MPNLLYRNCFIMAVADFDDAAGRWNLSVDISWRVEGGRRFQMLSTFQTFAAQDEAERLGLDAAKAWVDQNR